MQDPAIAVSHKPEANRFEVTLDGHHAFAEYEMLPGVMRMTHTVVSKALEGRGIAGAMVRTAFAYAREHGLKIDPQCPYVRAYMDKHPETQDLRVAA